MTSTKSKIDRKTVYDKMLPCFEKLFNHHYVNNGPNFDELVNKICRESKMPISTMDAYDRIPFMLALNMYPAFNRKNKKFIQIVEAFVNAYDTNQNLDVDDTLRNILSASNIKDLLVYNKQELELDKYTDREGSYSNPSWFAPENFYNIPFKEPLNFFAMFIETDIIKDGLLKMKLDVIKLKPTTLKKQRKSSVLSV